MEVLSVDTDSVFSHKIWDETELSKMAGKNMPFPMLSDETGSIGRLYDVYDTQTGKTLRATFIIDPQGYVHGSEVLTSPAGRNIEEILRLIKAFQRYTTTGEVMPSGWQEKDKTLIPSFERAGQIWKEWRPKNIKQG